MSTVLTNGVIIPENGSRNWGGDLANNWNILDVNVGYMTDVKNRVTTLENSVAENTANIQNNTSNISALQTSKQDNLSEQQIANIADVTNKANDSDVVHKSGDENISGVKNFNDVVLGEASGQIRIGNNGEGALFCTLRYDGQIYNISKQFVPTVDGEYNLGTSTNKWKTINGINPGALSLPNYSQSVTLSFAINSPIKIPFDGFIKTTLNVSNYAYIKIVVNDVEAYVGQSATKPTIAAFIPVSQNDVVKIQVVDGEYTGYGSVVLFKNKGSL